MKKLNWERENGKKKTSSKSHQRNVQCWSWIKKRTCLIEFQKMLAGSYVGEKQHTLRIYMLVDVVNFIRFNSFFITIVSGFYVRQRLNLVLCTNEQSVAQPLKIECVKINIKRCNIVNKNVRHITTKIK